MKSSRGFTVIELLIVVGVVAFASVIFFIQRQNIETATRDDARRTSINAMYYSLEEVYKEQNGSYPRTLTEETLPSVDPALFNDPNGVEIGLGESDFRYEPTGCTGNTCNGYTLRATLEQEDDYVKTNRTSEE
jgi:prepilin-type N-terminal cleavage/methylation domain-containing protein